MVAFSRLLLVTLRLLCVPVSTASTPESCAASLPESELPRPPLGSTARLIYLGVGTQNYSCASSTPRSSGAVASLLDITSLYCPRQHVTVEAKEKHNLVDAGRHYFTKDLVPTFNITNAWKPFIFSGTKVANVSSPGNHSVHNIDWLYLVPHPLASNEKRVQAVYRVKTMGGVPATPCTGDQEVPYMAEYWFYI